jgi:hypothetical protein
MNPVIGVSPTSWLLRNLNFADAWLAERVRRLSFNQKSIGIGEVVLVTASPRWCDQIELWD